MKRADLRELHYITPIANLDSIMHRGLLSKRRAKLLGPESIAMEEVQERRENKKVHGARPLHEYVNLYICARNPMLFKRKDQHAKICVLRISTHVLDSPMVVIADGNAASDYTGFWPAPEGLAYVDGDIVFAEYWNDADEIAKWRKKRVKCAEVLVPDKVDPEFILGVYVSCEQAKQSVEAMDLSLHVKVDPHLFFMS
jgi:hypothetical protein